MSQNFISKVYICYHLDRSAGNDLRIVINIVYTHNTTNSDGSELASRSSVKLFPRCFSEGSLSPSPRIAQGNAVEHPTLSPPQGAPK